jgi:hypothetical protein
MIDILLGLALLMPPPLPPPPPDRLAAAAELRRLAPFSERFRQDAVDRAIWRTAREALGPPGVEKSYAEFTSEATDRLALRLARSRADVDDRAGHCLDESVGHLFELADLLEMARIVPSRAGQALWEHAMRERAQACYDEIVSQLLVGVTPSLSLLAAKGLLGRLPRHDLSRGIPASLPGELEALCGKRTRGAFEVREGVLGIGARWADRQSRRHGGGGDAFFCLVGAARVSGFDPVVFRP